MGGDCDQLARTVATRQTHWIEGASAKKEFDPAFPKPCKLARTLEPQGWLRCVRHDGACGRIPPGPREPAIAPRCCVAVECRLGKITSASGRTRHVSRRHRYP